MDWKQFLKPNKGKIVLTLFFFVLAIVMFINLIFFAPALGETRRYHKIISPIIEEILIPNLFFILFPFTYLHYVVIYQITKIDFMTSFCLTFILNLIFWYLLSCLITWIDNKRKKK